MIKRLQTLLLFICFSGVSSYAQTTLWAEFVNPPGIKNPITVSGVIKDPATKDPIPFAGALFRVGDKVYNNTTADYLGRFELEIDPKWVKSNKMEVVYYFKLYQEQSKIYQKKSYRNEVIFMKHQTEIVKNFLR